MSSRSTTHASSPNATAPSDLLLARLLAPSTLAPGPVLCARVFSPGDPLLPVPASWLYPGLTPVFPRDRTALYCGLGRPCVRSCCYVECCNGGGAGFDRKASYCSASDCAQVVAFIECGLVACTTMPGCLPCQGEGVRTGGRLHPGLAGERLLNNAHRWPCSWLPCSATRVFSPGVLLRLFWPPGARVPGAQSTILAFDSCFFTSSYSVVLWLLV